MADLGERLRRGPVLLLDGAMGTELQRRGVPMHHVAWSAAALATHPEMVREVHADYIAAGAEVITANSFGASRHVLEPAGLGERVAELNRRAMALAAEARDRAPSSRPIWLAGSISSFIAEGDQRNAPPPSAARDSYAEQAALLAEAGADLLLLEMMRDIEYSQLAVECAQATGLPVWIGFTCKLDRSGEVVLRGRDHERKLADAIGPVTQAGGDLVAVMHTDFDAVEPALDIVARRWSGPVAAYPHSGDFAMPNWLFEDTVAPHDFAEAALGLSRRVQVIGGCCGIGPEYIAELRRLLDQTAAGAAG